MTRSWKGIKCVKVLGNDYNAALVRWCKRNLTHAKFGINHATPPTVYVAREFDLVYAISVFAHSAERHQIPWIQELGRVVRPGGYFLITTHGESYIGALPRIDQYRFRGVNYSSNTRRIVEQIYALHTIRRGMSGRPLATDSGLPTSYRRASHLLARLHPAHRTKTCIYSENTLVGSP